MTLSVFTGDSVSVRGDYHEYDGVLLHRQSPGKIEDLRIPIMCVGIISAPFDFHIVLYIYHHLALIAQDQLRHMVISQQSSQLGLICGIQDSTHL